MKKLFTLILVLVFSAASVLAQLNQVTVSHVPEKNVAKQQHINVPLPPTPLGILQGGENIASATEILSLPYTDIGTTAGYLHDYNEVCPYTATGAPDVVYSYTPAINGVIDISLCGDATDYDTKLYVYDTPTPVTGDAIACNDDLCSTLNYPAPYVSEVTGVPVTGGTTYYIVVDGYSSADFGTYELSVIDGILYPPPPNDDCSTATEVIGPFPQTVNGTTLGATVDCLGVLDWNAVWYAIELPYAVNDLTVDWCGTENMATVGVVFYETCPVSCIDYVLYDFNTFQDCGIPGGTTTALTSYLGIPGPATIYYPAYSVPQMDHVITFNVTEITCPDPLSPVADNITLTSANLTWTPGGAETDWEYAYGPAPFPVPVGPGIATISNTINPIVGLSSGLNYQFYVRAVCGSEYSEWVGPVSFYTLCESVTSFNENFDAVTPPALPPCWEKVGTSGSANTQASSPASAPNCLYIYGFSGAQPVVAMPIISNAGAGTHQLRFNLRANFTTGEAIEIGYMTDRSSDVTFVAVTSVIAGSLTYVEHTVLLGTAPGSYTTIAFRHPALLGYSCLIDDVKWEPIPACPVPTNLIADNLTLTSANLTWTPGGAETEWEYAYGEAPFPPPVGPGIATNSNTVNPISGLTAETNHQFYVRADCDGVFSPWSNAGSFFTGYCIPAPSSVDGLGITNVIFSTVINPTVAEPGNYGDYSALVGDVQRTADIPVLITYQTGYTYDTKIWIDWNDDLDFNDIGEEVYSGTSLSANPTTLAASFIVPLSAPLGNHRMRIGGVDVGPPTPCYTGSWGSFEDYTVNVLIEPDCLPPTDLVTSDITSTSAVLNWNGPIDSFFDVFFDPGSEPFEGTIYWSVNSPLAINDLEPGTEYEWSVRTDCGFETPKVDYFWMAMDGPGILLPPQSGGTYDEPFEDGTWYLYDIAPGDMDWWNIWFYNDPVDNTRMKKVRMGFWISSLDGATPGTINYVINWSDPAWPGPGFPTAMDEAFIHRSPVNGPVLIDPLLPQWIELYFIIPDYNPEWVSIDIWGENIIIEQVPTEPPVYSPLRSWWNPAMPGGMIVHECLPKDSGPTSTWSGPVLFSTLCGSSEIPYAENFDSKVAPAIPNCMSVTNDNADAYSWVTSTSYPRSVPNSMFINYNSLLAMDDWFFTPALSLDAGNYLVSFWYRGNGFYPEALEVKWGTAPIAAGMTNGPIFDNNNILTAIYEKGTGIMTVPAAGDYYVGWHGYSDLDMFYMVVDDIAIQAQYTWTGALTNAWNNPGNWSTGVVPDLNVLVIIPTAPTGPNFPVVGAGIVGNCYDVVLEPGATLTVEDGGTLNVLNVTP